MNEPVVREHLRDMEPMLFAGLLDNTLIAFLYGMRKEAGDKMPEKYRIIIDAMAELTMAEKDVDLRNMQAKLIEAGQLEAVGGIQYLATLDVGVEDDWDHISNNFGAYVRAMMRRFDEGYA